MNTEELQQSLEEYNAQLSLIADTLRVCNDESKKECLLSLQNNFSQLIILTQQSLDAVKQKERERDDNFRKCIAQLDGQYALFMGEMARAGAYNGSNESNYVNENNTDDIEDELSTLLGMKCAVYHTHKWGGQPSLHNAMVSAVVPRQESDLFQDLQVQVLFTHPTHSEMLPCPFYLEGECRFNDEQCRYSHGTVVALSNLKEAIEPDFDAVKVGSRVLVKLIPPDNKDITLKMKSSEKYHLWHRSIVTSVDLVNRTCTTKLEHGLKIGEKRKSDIDDLNVSFENIFPLNNESHSESSASDDSLSDTEYPKTKSAKYDIVEDKKPLAIEKSLQGNGPALGEWERHTRGIGSKIMFSMGYVTGTGLGAASDGRLQPVEARVMPVGKSLDHCMAISEKMSTKDPIKVEQKLKSLQKREEERKRRAYEREKEKEKRNVFNFLNKTLGDQPETSNAVPSTTNFKNSSCIHLNVEQFKINEGTKRLEKEINKLNQSLSRHSDGTLGHQNVKSQIVEKTKELNILKNKEKEISKEQMDRKNKQKMTVF